MQRAARAVALGVRTRDRLGQVGERERVQVRRRHVLVDAAASLVARVLTQLPKQAPDLFDDLDLLGLVRREQVLEHSNASPRRVLFVAEAVQLSGERRDLLEVIEHDGIAIGLPSRELDLVAHALEAHVHGSGRSLGA